MKLCHQKITFESLQPSFHTSVLENPSGAVGLELTRNCCGPHWVRVRHPQNSFRAWNSLGRKLNRVSDALCSTWTTSNVPWSLPPMHKKTMQIRWNAHSNTEALNHLWENLFRVLLWNQNRSTLRHCRATGETIDFHESKVFKHFN